MLSRRSARTPVRVIADILRLLATRGAAAVVATLSTASSAGAEMHHGESTASRNCVSRDHIRRFARCSWGVDRTSDGGLTGRKHAMGESIPCSKRENGLGDVTRGIPSLC